MYFDQYANPYAFTKMKAEEYCLLYLELYGVESAICRFFNVYGERQPTEGQYATVIGVFERQKRAGEALTVTGDGEQRRDFTHVSDIVSGLIAASQVDHIEDPLFPLGTGKNHSINEVAEMFEQTYRYIPARPGEARTTLADINFTKEWLGWEPTYKLEDYIKEFNASLSDT